MKTEISPYYYQTDIALIDDNEPFLNTLNLYLSKYFNCHTFFNPLAALKYENDLYNKKSLETKNQYPRINNYHGNELHEYFEKSKQRRNENELSVIIVDYDMPDMNGIDFCARIKDSSIKKILLTGKASHEEVLRAFNHKIIDFYIEKKEENMLYIIRDNIHLLQKSYFLDTLGKAATHLIQNETPYFMDSALADFFDETCGKLNICEHYFLSNPSRFLLIDENKNKFLMIISTEKELNEHIQILEDEEGPNDWIAKIKSRTHIPYFKTSDGFYEPETITNSDPLIKSDIIKGQINFYCAIVDANNISTDIHPWPKDISKKLH